MYDAHILRDGTSMLATQKIHDEKRRSQNDLLCLTRVLAVVIVAKAAFAPFFLPPIWWCCGRMIAIVDVPMWIVDITLLVPIRPFDSMPPPHVHQFRHSNKNK